MGSGFLVFKLNPFIDALVLSLQQNNLIRAPKFIGFENYRYLLMEDELFKTSLMVTFKYVFLTVPLVLVFALFIAYILNFKIKGVNFFRTAYYIPSILGEVLPFQSFGNLFLVMMELSMLV